MELCRLASAAEPLAICRSLVKRFRDLSVITHSFE